MAAGPRHGEHLATEEFAFELGSPFDVQVLGGRQLPFRQGTHWLFSSIEKVEVQPPGETDKALADIRLEIGTFVKARGGEKAKR